MRNHYFPITNAREWTITASALVNYYKQHPSQTILDLIVRSYLLRHGAVPYKVAARIGENAVRAAIEAEYDRRNHVPAAS